MRPIEPMPLERETLGPMGGIQRWIRDTIAGDKDLAPTLDQAAVLYEDQGDIATAAEAATRRFPISALVQTPSMVRVSDFKWRAEVRISIFETFVQNRARATAMTGMQVAQTVAATLDNERMTSIGVIKVRSIIEEEIANPGVLVFTVTCGVEMILSQRKIEKG